MTSHDTNNPAVLEQILRRSDDPTRRILFTDATIVTMDPDHGVLQRADLLVEGDTVTHAVDLSLFPNWQGGQQKRRFALRADGMLELTARLEEGTSEARTARLVWRRA